MRSYVDENDKKNEIRLLFRHPLYKDKVIIVVEGYSDVRLFRGILDYENIKLETIDGKRNLINAMKDLVGEFPRRIMAICDADHDHLSGDAEKRAEYSVFVTDHHDAEIMMLNSPALISFIDEYSSFENREELHSCLLNSAFDAAYTLGLLRWINTEENLTLKFKGLNFNQFVSVEKVRIDLDVDVLINSLLIRSSNKSAIATKDYLLGKIKEYRGRNSCELQVSCGHDLTNIIAIVFRQRWASVEINIDHGKVESALRLGYQKEYFQTTKLFNKVKEFLGLANSCAAN